MTTKNSAVGHVALIGAGPGDPKLITVGGVDSLARADIVVYDRLAHPALLAHAPSTAVRLYVGKQADRHAMSQDGINALLAERAAAGDYVARLKGGDPFVFGRGGEEAEYLRERGIPFTVIPGVTSAIAAPAYAGIPVTHRDLASSFAVITGHERAESSESITRKPGQAEGRRQWERIAYAADTLIFLMGVENLAEIVNKLIEHGRHPSTPIALVRWGTWAGRQQTVVGDLLTIVQRVTDAGLTAPAVTVVGEVVKLRERIQWWDNGPLAGRRILVTRARESASGFAEALRALGAEPVEFPLIRIAAPSEGYVELDDRIQNLDNYQWICFASAPAVDTFFMRLAHSGLDARALSQCRVAVVGPATAEALLARGIRADYVPIVATGRNLGQELPGITTGARVLIPQAAESEPGLTESLTERGAAVDNVTVYVTRIDDDGASGIRERLIEGDIDAITFTSSSTVRNFAAAIGDTALLANVTVVCIGPTTASTAAQLLGREPDLVASDHTIPGIIAALQSFYMQ